MGSYHTLDIEPDRWVIIRKPAWDALQIELMEQAIASIGKVEIGAILMGEGSALICTVSPSADAKVLHRVEVALPKKKIGPTSQLEKSLEKFYSQCVEGALQHVRFDALKAIIIGSADAGQRDEFYRRLLDHAQRAGTRAILDNKGKFMRLQVKGATPAALSEVLGEPRIAALLANTKAAQETKMIDAYHKMHNADADRTAYGVLPVLRAAEQGAIKHLLISDALFRSTRTDERSKYGQIVETVRANGGESMVFASGSVPGLELAKLGGIAAILNFPIFSE